MGRPTAESARIYMKLAPISAQYYRAPISVHAKFCSISSQRCTQAAWSISDLDSIFYCLCSNVQIWATLSSEGSVLLYVSRSFEFHRLALFIFDS